MRGSKNRKSRTGCSRCKEKRLKCDEAIPACNRCTSRNIVCPGYVRSYTWSTKYEVFKPSSALNGRKRATSSSLPAKDADPQIQQLEQLLSSPPPQTSPSVLTPELPVAEDISLMDYLLSDTDYGAGEILEYGADENDYIVNPMVSNSNDTLNSDMLSSTPGATSIWTLTYSSFMIPNQHEVETDSKFAHSRTDSELALQGSHFSGNAAFATSVASPIQDASTILIEYYFKEVANIFSCYDSKSNPFRTAVSRSWASSPPIYYALQSMAASSLADELPQFQVVSSEMRRRASAAIEKEIGSSEIAPLLALIMIGPTASWHHSSNLGLNEFNSSCLILDKLLSNSDKDNQLQTEARNLQFFEEALIYWRMLLAYVTDEGSHVHSLPLTYRSGTQEPSYPHPWTGVGRDAQLVVMEVGKLIRSELKRLSKRSFSTQASILQAQQAIERAQILEKRLRQLTPPAEFSITNPGDDYTPVDHFLKIAEAYRYAGLLQLYRVFPDLLARRSRALAFDADLISFDSVLDSVDLSLPEAREACLTRLALHILGILRLLPVESRTRCVQPFLFVCVSSELRLPPRRHDLAFPSRTPQIDVSSEVIDIVLARKFVINRLTYLKNVLPSKPLVTMLKLVQETWERMDSRGGADVYWVDVMIDMRYETLMG